MADTVDALTRSRIMSAVRGKNTRPEIKIRRLLHRAGFRFRLHDPTLPGKPDIVLRRHRAVVQVNGCFWHGHSCPLFRLPGTRPEFWKAKIDRNIANDAGTLAALRALDWRVALVWECALKGRRRLSDEMIESRLSRWLKSSSRTLIVSGKKKPTGRKTRLRGTIGKP